MEDNNICTTGNTKDSLHPCDKSPSSFFFPPSNALCSSLDLPASTMLPDTFDQIHQNYRVHEMGRETRRWSMIMQLLARWIYSHKNRIICQLKLHNDCISCHASTIFSGSCFENTSNTENRQTHLQTLQFVIRHLAACLLCC